MEPRHTRTAGHICDIVGGRLIGRRDTVLSGVAPLARAGPDELSFLAGSRYLPYFRDSRAGAVLTTAEFQDVTPGPATRIIVSNVRAALAGSLAELYPEVPTTWGVHPTAVVGRGARWRGRLALGPGSALGNDVSLGADCVIDSSAIIEERAVLGDGCRIGSHAVVGPGTRLGNRVVLKSGARVGVSGYAYASTDRGHTPLTHAGGCYVGDDVEIGANTTVSRGSIDDTTVGAGTKIDNLVQIGHNVHIGKRCLIMAQVGLAGSTVVEDDVLLAGQAGLAGHLTVGRCARVAAQAGVIGDIPAGATVSGYPARSHRDVLRQAAALSRLARMTRTLERLTENSGV